MHMELVLIVLGVGFLLEMLLFLPILWNRYYLQVVICLLSSGCLAFAVVGLAIFSFNVASFCVLLISIYRLINLLRVIEGRMNLRYMYNVVFRTSVVLILMQVLALVIWFIVDRFDITDNVWMWLIVSLQVSAGIILLASTLRRLKHTMVTHEDTIVTSNELPNVTIAIPARNETDDLYECLVSLLKNDYPKLEILVLDDCSQLRRTPEIIREFAHAGVRFVKGDVPMEGWLAKNQAYDKLLREASGEIVLFCGVDVRFQADTIRQIILTMLSRNKRMVSVLPLRERQNKVQYAAVQASRYFWELAPPRRLFNRPPILSTCWAVYRSDILKLGGFAAVSRAIIPEAYFAKQMLKRDNYSFLRADTILRLFSVKSNDAQRSTAIRTRYPQLHRRPETVAAITFVGIVCFIAPYAVLILSLVGVVAWYFAFLALVSMVLCNAALALITNATRAMSWYIAPFSFLPVICTDIVLTHYSLYKYEFSEVLWKGRNVCLPVMHVIPRLPKL